MKKYANCSVPVFALLIFLSGCCKDDSTLPTDSKVERIQFNKLAVGQSSSYLGLLGENYYLSTTDDFVYTDDTLVLTVVAHDAQGYKVAETLHYNGDVDTWMAAEKDSVYHYYIEIKNDSLFIRPTASATYVRSRMFDYWANQSGLPLAEIADPAIQISGWKTDLPYCECDRTGYAENYSLFGQNYDRSNVVVANSHMAFDGPGSTYVYSPKHGIVRFSTYGWWTQSGYGWDLLPAE